VEVQHHPGERLVLGHRQHAPGEGVHVEHTPFGIQAHDADVEAF